MLIYIVVFALTTMLAWLYPRTTPIAKKIIFCLMVLIPSIVAGLRGVGTDYLLYQERFEALATGSYKITSFSLVYVLMKIFLAIGASYQLFTFIISFITLFITFYVFCQYENKVNVSVAVFSYMTMFYLMSFNIFRQILATAILLLAFYNLFEKKRKLVFWLLSAVVFLTHSAVAIFSLLYFVLPLVKNEQYRKARILVYMIVTALIMTLPLVSRLLSIFADYFPHYAYYFLNFSYTGIGLGILRYLVLCIIPLVCVIYLNGSFPYRETDKIQPYFVLSVVGTVLWLTSYISTSYIYRIGYVGLAALPIVHGALWKNTQIQESEQLFCTTVLRCVIVVTLIFFCWFDYVHLNSGSVYPYQFFWQV